MLVEWCRPTYIFDRACSMTHGACFRYNLVDIRPLLWAFAQHPPCLESAYVIFGRLHASPISAFILSENGG